MRLNLTKSQRWFILILSITVFLMMSEQAGELTVAAVLVLAAGIWLFVWGKGKPEEEQTPEE